MDTPSLSPKAKLAESGAGDQQPVEHSGSGLVTSHRPGAQLHSANRLFGAVVGPRDTWIVEESDVAFPILADADQQEAQFLHDDLDMFDDPQRLLRQALT